MKIPIALPITLAAVALAWSQTTGSHAKKSQLDGVWELVSGQPLPKGARDIKILSAGHVMFVAYDTETGKPLLYGRRNIHAKRKLLYRTHGLRERCNRHRSGRKGAAIHRKVGRRYIHPNRYSDKRKASFGGLEARQLIQNNG